LDLKILQRIQFNLEEKHSSYTIQFTKEFLRLLTVSPTKNEIKIHTHFVCGFKFPTQISISFFPLFLKRDYNFIQDTIIHFNTTQKKHNFEDIS
jgi:hypothetical protein